jgi:hypothetical protein
VVNYIHLPLGKRDWGDLFAVHPRKSPQRAQQLPNGLSGGTVTSEFSAVRCRALSPSTLELCLENKQARQLQLERIDSPRKARADQDVDSTTPFSNHELAH